MENLICTMMELIASEVCDRTVDKSQYGTTKNRVSVQQVKHGGKFRYALSRIWLPYDTLKFHYPSLVGKRALLPFYEVRRWFKLLFCGGVKRSVNELRLNSSATNEEQTETKEMLSKLEIDH